jgi:hypothetical protein
MLIIVAVLIILAGLVGGIALCAATAQREAAWNAVTPDPEPVCPLAPVYRCPWVRMPHAAVTDEAGQVRGITIGRN